MEVKRIKQSPMKSIKKILYASLMAIFFLAACESPDDLKPPVSREGLNSIKAKILFEDGTYSKEFEGRIEPGSDEIIVKVPIFYGSKDNIITMDMLKNMRVRADLDDNVTVRPKLLYMDLSEDNEIFVTDQRKEEKRYIVKAEILEPSVVERGFKPGSEQLLFAKKLKADLGITVDHLTGAIALSGDYLVLNTRGENSLYIDAKTGEIKGHVELGEALGGVTNFYHDSDDDGNILLCNLTPNDGEEFKIWRINSVESTPELFLKWNTGGRALGRKISVTGSIDKNAIIVAPIYGWNQDFARWQIIDGVLQSETPEIIVTNVNHWGSAADIVQTSATDINSDYFVASYAFNVFCWVDGVSNKIKARLDPMDINFLHNCVDYIEFNKAPYAVTALIDIAYWAGWNPADMVWLLDVGDINKFYGALDCALVPSDNPSPTIVWKTLNDTWGAQAASGPRNDNLTADVLLAQSDDGYYMYLYFLFTNGFVVGYQFDCIDM